MFIAIRDLKFAKGRFLLMGLVIALVALLVTLLGGLSAGLIKNNISALMTFPASHIAFEYDDQPNYRNSMVDREMWSGWSGYPGVRSVQPLGHTMFSSRSNRDEPLEIVLWGIEPGSFLEPEVTAGDQLGGIDNGVIISSTLVDKGLNIGDTITLDRVLTELKVIGISGDANIAHVPIVFASLRKWQEATYGPPGGPEPGEKLPAVLFDFASVIALQLDDGVDIQTIDEDLGTVTMTVEDSYRASTGYIEELYSVTAIQAFLVIISAVVIGAFFTIWTIQRTQEIGLVKALGASNAYLLKDAIAQAAILLLVSTTIGVLVGYLFGRLWVMPSGIPFMLEMNTVLLSAVILMATGLVGGILSIHMITRIDPIIALGRER